jgi:molybdopterin molybdotransferase
MTTTQRTSITVAEALDYILGHFAPLPPEPTPLHEATGRVLAAPVVSALTLPPFANSAMDGYAVRAADVAGATSAAPAELRVIGYVAAGYVAGRTVAPGTAIRIMTGAPLPEGADTVVRFEDTSEGTALFTEATPTAQAGKDTWRAADNAGGTVAVYKPVAVRDNVRPAGEDVRAGTTVLAAGTVLRPAEIALLAAIGQPTVPTHRRPRVAILGTGDELVDPAEPLAPGQIHDANSYALAAQVAAWGGIPIRLGIARDTLAALQERIDAGFAAQPDLFVTSAGVSVGDYDIVKDVLNAEGQMHFWQVRMKPGKPLAFGRIRGVPMLGLPGNPVSSLVSMELFGRPALRRMLGHTRLHRPVIQATVSAPIENTSGRDYYIRAWVEPGADEGYRAATTGEQGSGLITSLTRANALLIVPAAVRLVQPGETIPAIMLDWNEEVF